MHVNLLQHVDGEGVDLGEKAHQEGDWEAMCKTWFMNKKYREYYLFYFYFEKKVSNKQQLGGKNRH